MLRQGPDVSLIIPIYNGSVWIDQCFEAILNQTAKTVLIIEVCICNDSSTDDTAELLSQWRKKFNFNGIPFHVFENESGHPKGVGYAKNKAVSLSSGNFLCFQDIDDVMLPDRILKQYDVAIRLPKNTIIGSKFKRNPDNSTIRYTRWANSMSQTEINIQVYTSQGPTVIMPTWFFHRDVFDKVGGFVEDKVGTPEDLIFFYKHLDTKGIVHRVDECLLIYTYHPGSATFSVHENTIWCLRIERLQMIVLTNWIKFTIWNAGKQGRKFYKSLSVENQQKVIAFCDVDKNKIGKCYIPFNDVTHTTGRPLNIVDFRDAIPPFVICVKMNLTNGEFEKNLKTLNLTEGQDYVHLG